MTNTPGYTKRLSIKFVGNRAFYWSSGFRWLPIKLKDAKRFVANKEADLATPDYLLERWN